MIRFSSPSMCLKSTLKDADRACMGNHLAVGAGCRNSLGIDVAGVDKPVREFSNPAVRLVFDVFP
jgi:hypothetical protein